MDNEVKLARDEDARMLAEYASGDQAAALSLTSRHAPRMLALAQRMLGDRAEAEDIAQEAMLRLWRIAPNWRPGETRISTWLYRVTTNLCLDRLRKTARIDPGEPPDLADARPDGEASLLGAEALAALHAAIARLPERQRVAVVLRHLEERANPEISAIMDISVEAVESLLARGKRALIEELRTRPKAPNHVTGSERQNG